jgi:hypothetical protein
MKKRYLIIITIVSTLIGVGAIGLNAANGQKQAQQISRVDQAGGDVTQLQSNLAHYSKAHMGSSVTVFLAGSYQRSQAASNTTPVAAGDIYSQAQSACVSRTTAVNQAKCVQDYLNAHAPGQSPAPVQSSSNRSSYTKTYLAPSWTPDLAGLSLLVGFAAAALAGWLWIIRRF